MAKSLKLSKAWEGNVEQTIVMQKSWPGNLLAGNKSMDGGRLLPYDPCEELPEKSAKP